MKILLTGFHFDTIGGLEIVSANIAHTLVDAGHEVQCAAVHGRGAIRKNGYEIVGLLPENRFLRSAAVRMRGLYPKRKLRELIAWADVIIACHCHTLPLVYRCRGTAAKHPPVAAWLHGLEVWGQYGEDYAEDLQQAKRLVAVSRYTSDTVAQLLGTAYRPTVIHNSIDTEFFRPSNTHEIERLSILTVGRHEAGTEHKGYDMLIDALTLIRRRSPALPLTLRITGEGSLLSTLRAKAEALGVGSMVEFTGKVSMDKLRRLYATSDVFAFPSRLKRHGNTIHGEGFGVVNIEAAACGRPVLTSTHGGCPETILDGVTGILVDPTSVEAVAAGLEQLFRMTPAERDAMGQRGRQHVLENFSHVTLSQKLAELLDGLKTC
jgi:glycosyltransferase involved in cell wall biosynthesis